MPDTFSLSLQCIDKDECTLGIDNCPGLCINNVGSYTCGCGVGYTLNSNGQDCDGKYSSINNNFMNRLSIQFIIIS